MGHESIKILSGLAVDNIESIFVYVCDALRWDFVPQQLVDCGVTLRTATHGLNTPHGMASLATGRYPLKHGVSQFSSKIPESQDTIFDISVNETSLQHNQWEGHPIFDLFGQTVGRPIEEIEPPFLYFEHDHGAHAPYPEFAGEFTVEETFRKLSGKPDQLQSNYKEGVRTSVERFKQRMQTLKDRNLYENTLIVFTSDHGELLGEHGGFVGHNLPATPELVYVPTVFLHPSLESRLFKNVLVKQADLFPTLRDVLNQPATHQEYDGQSLLRTVQTDRLAYNRCTVHFPGETPLDRYVDSVYETESVWTCDGGHVFNNSNSLKRLLTGIYDVTQSAETGAYNTNQPRISALTSGLKLHFPKEQTFGSPTVTRSEAKTYCSTLADTRTATKPRNLPEETIEHLENLGYR